jgi:hypothetical protein
MILKPSNFRIIAKCKSQSFVDCTLFLCAINHNISPNSQDGKDSHFPPKGAREPNGVWRICHLKIASLHHTLKYT